MSKLGRLLPYGGLAAAALAAYFWPGDPPKRAQLQGSRAKKVAPLANGDEDLTAIDFTAHFPRVDSKVRNLFGASMVSTALAKSEVDHVPSEFAGGAGSWIFTGIAEVDGTRMALLQDSQASKGAFVKQGDRWKSCKVVRVGTDDITLQGDDGSEQVVSRFVVKAAKAAPSLQADGKLPVTIASPVLHGPIGPIEIHPLPGVTAGPVRIIRK